MKKGARFRVVTASLINNSGVKLVDFSSKFTIDALNCSVTPHIYSKIAEEAVAAYMIEMLLRVDNQQFVFRPDRRSISVNRLRAGVIGACVDDRRNLVASDEPSRTMASNNRDR